MQRREKLEYGQVFLCVVGGEELPLKFMDLYGKHGIGPLCNHESSNKGQ